jgi:hypothetical protein
LCFEDTWRLIRELLKDFTTPLTNGLGTGEAD